MKPLSLRRALAHRAAGQFVALWLALCALAPALAQGAAAAPPAGAASAPASRNVYAGGREVRPAGPTQGDFVAVGGRVIVDQPVGGDATLAGGAVDVRAPVADDLRAAGGDVSVENSVGGEAFVAGGNVTVRPQAGIAGMARLFGSSVTMDGRIDGDLQAAGQSVKVDGEVRGNVRLEGATIELGPKARIGGSLHYASGSELRRDPAATIAGPVVREPAQKSGAEGRGGMGDGRRPGHGPFWAGGIVSYLALLACAAVFLLVVPTFSRQAPERIRSEPWLSLAIGFGSLVAVPMLAVLLFVTLLGIPLGIAVMALYPVLLLTGFLVGVLFVAQLLPPALRKPLPLTFKSAIAYCALSLLLVLLVGLVPFVGGLAIGLVSIAGIGACVLELYRRRKAGPIQVTV